MYPRVLGEMPKINHSTYYEINVIINLNLLQRILDFVFKVNSMNKKESASLASNSLGSPAVALHETIFIYIFIASLIMAKFPSSFLQLFKGFSPVANSFASMSFRKVISVACQLQGCRQR